MSPMKNVKINGIKRTVSGVSENDPYFIGLTDGIEDDFAYFCQRFLRKDYLCWDIGANIGITSFIMSDVCSQGRVIALDGGEGVSKLHSLNIKTNQVTNVEVINAAMAETDGEMGFHENSAYGAINLKALSRVKTISPIGLINRIGKAPDFVKIDVEGYEFTILKTALDIFKQNGTLVHFEFNTWVMILSKIVQPMEFLEWIANSFEHVLIRSPGKSDLEPLSAIGLTGMLARNMTQLPYTFLDDIVVTSDASKLN